MSEEKNEIHTSVICKAFQANVSCEAVTGYADLEKEKREQLQHINK